MDLSNPTAVSIDELRDSYSRGSSSPKEVLDATLDKVAASNPLINAVAYLNEDEAREQAAASERRWAQKRPLSAIDGVPVTIKDSVGMAGTPWRHGSAPNRDLPFATIDTPPALRLKEAGAVVFAKTTMPDFGMLASGISSLYGVTRNPWNTSMNPGGSSAGAGASLAAGIGWAAVGTDIAGSVRLPAAHCGLVALKPTQGRVPHLVPSTIRSAGPMARSVREAALMLEVISQGDSRDVFGLPGSPVTAEACDPTRVEIGTLRVGVILDFGYGYRLHPATVAMVREAASHLAASGADVTELDPVFDYDAYEALDRLFQVRARAEWESHGGRASEVLPEVADWCARAKDISATQHERDASAVLQSASHVQSVTAHVDIVLSAVIPGAGHRAEMVGLDKNAPLAHCAFTCWYNQTGQPGVTLPFGWAEGMPLGLQIIGQRFDDATVMQVAGWLEAQRAAPIEWPIAPRELAPVDESYFAANYGGYSC